MPPPGHELLLGAIRAEPDDDTVRLAYADWLDENGDPARADFVRVQCRLAALGHGPLWPNAQKPDPETLARGLDREAARLILRQGELWEEHRDEWLGELPGVAGSVLLFHRGFASVVIVEHPGGIVRYGARLCEVAPVARIIFRNCLPDAVEVTLLRPWFDTIRGLTVGWASPPAGAGNRVAEVLGRGPHLARLRDLSLFGAGLTNAGAHELAAAQFMRRLARVDLAGNEVRDAGAISLANALDPTRLRVLDLSGNPLTGSCRANLRRRFGDRVSVEGTEEAEG
jgi:uncharacterized protein (TIGR02996 family)